jgi:hypothetical protein
MNRAIPRDDPQSPDPLLPEAAILERYPVIGAHNLRQARKDGTVAWTPGRWKSPWYRCSHIEAFIQTLAIEKTCPAPDRILSLNCKANGSPISREPPSSTDAGLIQELADHAARASAQRISNSPKDNSPKPSSAKIRRRPQKRGSQPSSKVISLNGRTTFRAGNTPV